MRNGDNRRVLFIVILVLFFVSRAWGAAPVEVRTNYAALSGGFAPIWLAQDEGLFAKYGLKTDLQYIPLTAVQAIIGGTLDIANSSNELVNARLGGADVVYFSGLVNRFVFFMYCKPEISKISDLKGKTIGATQPNAVTDMAARVVLRESGLTLGKDFRILYTRGMPETLAALTKGVIDAGVLSPPSTLQARKMGLKELVNITAKNIPMIQTGLGATKTFLKERPETVRSYLRGLLEGIKIARTDSDRAKRVISKYTRTTDPEMLEESYRTFVDAWEKVPYISPIAIKTLLEFTEIPVAKSANPEEFFDNSFLRELEGSGFVEKLYSQ